MLNFLFGIGGRGGGGGVGGKMVGYSGYSCLICNRNKNKANYPNSIMKVPSDSETGNYITSFCFREWNPD